MQKEITVNQRIYPLEVVFAASFVFLDKCYVYLDKGDRMEVKVRLRPRPECGDKQFEAVVGDFENELLNQAFRLKVAKRTQETRDAIIHRALFSALPDSADLNLGDDLDADYLDDPLGIAVPWEEKYDKGKD